MTDVLILYEHKNRELENACLIAAELELRGYTVSIQCIYSLKRYFTKTRILLVPHLYDDAQVVMFCKNFWLRNNLVIDMQYEQVLRKSQHDGIHNPSGQAKQALHLAWGKAQEELYMKHGIPETNISVVGHVGMDLMDSKFDLMFKSKKEMAREFNLDPNKIWLLFISTFSYKMKTDEELNAYYLLDKSGAEGVKQSVRAQSIILEWLKKIAIENENIEVIYRRHPSEREDPDILEIEKRINNFHCIDQYTMRQWVRISDRLYTWYSTSIADAYFGNKTCLILRPEKVAEDYELDIMHNADFITNYTDFKHSVDIYDTFTFPIKDEVMYYYYGKTNKRKQRFAYENVSDVCEYVMNHPDKFKCNFEYTRSRYNICDSNTLRGCIGEYMCGLLFEIAKRIKIPVPLKWQTKKIFRRITLYNKEAYKTSENEKEYRKNFINLLKDKDSKEGGL